MATPLENRAWLLLGAFHVAHARYMGKNRLFLHGIVCDCVASIIGVHAYYQQKEKVCIALPFLVLNLQNYDKTR